ncbi:MAG TPA: sialate O-acetylesterase, partial [Polyangiaceae bacterium]|nr:sialate O-acetylesterase [Polyangiaceae bacterium]
PHSPAELVAMASATEYRTDLEHRAFIRQALQYALAREAGASSKPYTTAIQSWFVSTVNSDPRTQHMFVEQLGASGLAGPIDLYILAGQSNMVGLTESGGYNGPDPEIRAALQARTAGRNVVTLNCALSATSIGEWVPSAISSTHIFDKKLRHNLTRECIEFARGIKDRSGRRARIRGFFLYQGEADVSYTQSTGNPSFISEWPNRYRQVVDFIRDEFGDIPAVHAQIASTNSTDPQAQTYWRMMQDAQATATSQLSRSAMIVTKDLTTRDGLHLNDASQAVAGQRFATALLGLL